MKVQLDEHGFLLNYTIFGEMQGFIEVDELPNNLDYFAAYQLVNGKWQLNDERLTELQNDRDLSQLRLLREKAMEEIDKYQLVFLFASLLEHQKEELSAYRQAWLDVTRTKLIPKQPEWMK